MKISHAFTPSSYSSLSAQAAAPKEPFDARAKGDDMALLDNFVRTSALTPYAAGQLKDFAVGSLPGVGFLKNGSDYLTNSIFGNDKAARKNGIGALLNLGGTAGLIYGLASGSGVAALGSAALLIGSGIAAAQ